MKKTLSVSFMAPLLVSLSVPAVADSDSAKFKALERQIQELQARIAALEERVTFTSFMPDFAERFHVMHRAGEAGDWAVASHELEEMKRLTRISISIDTDKGKLMQAMMQPSFEALGNAIEHGNHKKFAKALSQTTDTCNACHTATGSGFVQVTLDAQDSLGLRHPHKFMEQQVPGGHTH